MKCASCGKEINYGYFWEGSSVRYICTECLLSYKRGKVKKYDRKQIREMYEKGYSFETMATVMGTRAMTIKRIVRKEFANEDEIHQRRLVKTKKSY